MPKEREKLLLKVLDKAADLSRDIEDPSAAICKAAEEQGLTAPEACRVTEMFNKAKSVAFLKAASSDRRAEDFPLADSGKVLEGLFGAGRRVEKTAASIEMLDFAKLAAPAGMAKAASAEDRPRPVFAQPSAATLLKRADQAKAVSDSALRSLTDRAAAAFVTADRMLCKMASELEAAPERSKAAFAQNVVNAIGVELGGRVLSKIAAKSRFCRIKVPLGKTAHAVSLPSDEVHDAFQGFMRAAHEGAALMEDRNLFFSKRADAIPDMKEVASLFGASKPANVAEGLDPDTGMPSKLSGALKAVESKADFLKLYKYDPVINGYPLMDALQAYNDIRRTTPSLSGNKLWIKAAMRRYLTQGGMLDQFELKDMLGTSAARAKEKSDIQGMAEQASIKPEKEY